MNDLRRQGGQTALATGVWSLWIDMVGGYRVLEGDCFTIGGPAGDDIADIAVRTAWRRQMATLSRIGEEFWLASTAIAGPASQQALGKPVVLDARLPIEAEDIASTQGQPTLRLKKPSPLSETMVLTLDPPHRFVCPSDAIILLDKTILIGPERTNHIRATQMLEPGLVVVRQADRWWIRRSSGATEPLRKDEPVEVGGLVMTLRREVLSPAKEKS